MDRNGNLYNISIKCHHYIKEEDVINIFNNSTPIVKDNINRLILIKGYHSHKSLCEQINIPESTLSTWLSQNNNILPSFDKLDCLCNKLEVHTSDLFIENSTFNTLYVKQNNSMNIIRKRLNNYLIEYGLFTIQSRILFLFHPSDSNYSSCESLYYSYTRVKNYRCIPIQQLDEFAMRLEIETYKLLR